jgi:hypothetical protein
MRSVVAGVRTYRLSLLIRRPPSVDVESDVKGRENDGTRDAPFTGGGDVDVKSLVDTSQTAAFAPLLLCELKTVNICRKVELFVKYVLHAGFAQREGDKKLSSS